MSRGQVVIKSSIALYAFSAVSVIGGLLTVPILTRSLSVEEFGLYQLITSFIIYVSFADLGVSAALINLVGFSYSNKDLVSLRKWLSAGFQANLLSVIFYYSVAIGLFIVIPAEGLLNIPASLENEARYGILIVVVASGLVFVLRYFYQILVATQRMYIGQLFAVASTILTTTLLVIGGLLHWSVVSLILCYSLGGIVLGGSCLLWLRYKDPELFSFISLKFVGWNGIISVYKEAIGFVGHQISGLIVGNAAPLFLAMRSNLTEVAIFSITHRIFMLIGSTITSFDISIWPAILDARTKLDWEWVRSRFGFALTYALVACSIFAIALVPWNTIIVSWWAGSEFIPPMLLTVGCAIYFGLIYPWNNLYSKINSAFQRQLKTTPAAILFAGVFVVLVLLFAPLLGAAAAPIAMIVSSLISVSWYLPFDTQKVAPFSVFILGHAVGKWLISLFFSIIISVVLFYSTGKIADPLTRIIIGLSTTSVLITFLVAYLWFGYRNLRSIPKLLTEYIAKGKFIIGND